MKVSKIEKIINISMNYDIEVEDNHNFFINGILVHNCQGVDITNKSNFIKHLPKKINTKDELYVRGELVILNEDYDKIEGTSARNIVAGLINRKDFKEDDVANISFISYTIMGQKYTKKEQFEILENNGFKTAWHESYKTNDITNINSKLFELASYDFGMKTDGLVICDSEYKNEEKYRPCGCFAYKINQQKFTTRLIGIEWQGPSKDGKYSPVGIVEPTEVGGVIVQKVTLNNIDFIENMGLMIGDYITIVRSGDVIPKLLSVENHTNVSHKIEYPSECTCCHSELFREGPFLYCKNENCEDKLVSQIETFIKNLDIDNASFKTLKNFRILTIKDLLNFIPNPEYKSEVNFENELKEKMFTKSRRELFTCLNMKDIARKTMNVIIDSYTWEAIENHTIEGTPYWQLPKGIGEITFNKFLECYRKNLDLVDMITWDSRYNYKENEKLETNKMEKNGMSICFTGKLDTMGRTEASEIAQNHGYEVKSSVTKGLTYLVTNTPDSGTSKNKKAQEFGTKIITESQFLEMMK